jgi:hypothetical protein
MSDDYTILNPGIGGDVMDETAVTYPTAPTTRKRPRVVVTGEGIDDIVPALNDTPVGGELGIAIRPIFTGYPGNSVIEYNNVTLVPTSFETTVVTYVVPAGKRFYFIGYNACGNTNAIYRLYVNGSVYFVSRSSAANLNVEKSYSHPPFYANQTTTISLKVLHYTTASCDFEGTLIGYII